MFPVYKDWHIRRTTYGKWMSRFRKLSLVAILFAFSCLAYTYRLGRWNWKSVANHITIGLGMVKAKLAEFDIFSRS